MTPPRLAMIDLDGTLIDSVADLHVAINGMMQLLGGPERSEQQVRAWIGNGVDRLLHRALTGETEGNARPSLYTQATALFDNIYQANNGHFSALYPGVIEGLDYLQSQGCTLGCVTNKPARFAEPLLRRFAIDGYFQLLLGGDSLARKKPDPLPLTHAAEVLKVSPQQSLIIGDSMTDLAAGRAAGFGCVMVSYGYNHGLDIRDGHPQFGPPDAVLDSLAELPQLFNACSGA